MCVEVSRVQPPPDHGSSRQSGNQWRTKNVTKNGSPRKLVCAVLTSSTVVLLATTTIMMLNPFQTEAYVDSKEKIEPLSNASSTKTAAHDDETSVVHPDDGCGLHGEKSKWIPYTSRDYEIMHHATKCSPDNVLRKRDMANLTSLQCSVDIGVDSMVSIISQFERILFIGDSVLRQQYLNLLCLLSNTAEGKGLIAGTYGKSAKELWDFNATFNNRTILQLTQFGWIFDHSSKPLYQGAFPESIKTFTERDAIIINAGHHYNLSIIFELKDALTFIKDMSHSSKAHIFFMEVTDEQWPTSNGMFTVPCPICPCEPLGPDRILGVGHADALSAHQINMSLDPTKNTGPIFDLIFDLIDFGSTPEGRKNNALCIPSCLPASWRRDVTNAILESNASNMLHIVPIWRQLVDRGLMHSRFPGDCTHKAADALIAMNQQLVRSMLKVLNSRDETK